MFSKLKGFVKKHWEFVLYALFGIFTTVTNYAIYLPLYNIAHLSATLSNWIAWIAAVIVAFLTNKPFVFKSHDWSAKVVASEFLKFVGCRVTSGLTETLILMLTVDILDMNGNIMKVLTNVVVIIINYVGSKLVVFRNKNQET